MGSNSKPRIKVNVVIALVLISASILSMIMGLRIYCGN